MPSVKGQRKAGKHNNLPAKKAVEDIPADIRCCTLRTEFWVWITEDLKARNLWSATYSMGVSEMVHTAYRLAEVRDILKQDGILLPKLSSDGTLIIGKQNHPLLPVEQTLSRSMGSWFEKYGMTPKDIVFLSQTDPTPSQVIDAELVDRKIIYFRD